MDTQARNLSGRRYLRSSRITITTANEIQKNGLFQRSRTNFFMVASQSSTQAWQSDEDLRKLISAIETALGVTQHRQEVANQAKPTSSIGRWVFVGLGGLAALLVVGLLVSVGMRKPVVVVAPNPTATQVNSTCQPNLLHACQTLRTPFGIYNRADSDLRIAGSVLPLPRHPFAIAQSRSAKKAYGRRIIAQIPYASYWEEFKNRQLLAGP